MNLSNLPNLLVFALYYAIISCNAPRKAAQNAPPSAVFHYINIILGTISESNKDANLWFDFLIIGCFRGCLDQDWKGTYNKVIRIADGKPLELELQMVVSTGNLETKHPGQDELFVHIMEKVVSLRDYPKIFPHCWNPTFCVRGLSPFPHGQVRSRCEQ